VKDWFETLEERERVFVFAGALAVFFALIYFLLWAPLVKHKTALEADVSNLQTAVAEIAPLLVHSNSGEESPNNLGSPSTRQGSPIVIVDQTLNIRGLNAYRKRSQPTANDGVRVEFENVSFDELILWLGDLGDQYAMQVQAASFARGSQSSVGRVNATLTLEREL